MSGKKGSEKKWCAYCDIQVPIGAVFCPRCGEPIDPSYIYGESVSSEEALFEKPVETDRSYEIAPIPTVSSTPSGQRLEVLYEGIISGLVTGESELILTKVVGHSMSGPNPNLTLSNSYFGNLPTSYYGGFTEAKFAMKLEPSFEGVPDEILVETKFGYFGIGDKVVLQGKIFKINLEKWGRPMFAIVADHFYNESLQIGNIGLRAKNKVLYEGTIRGLVIGESRTRGNMEKGFNGNYFVIKLEENIGIAGIPDEILVRSNKQGYFREGDKVILEGRIIETVLKKWGRPSYTLQAEDYYNETLQASDEGLEGIKPAQVLYEGIIQGTVTKESRIKFLGSPRGYHSGTYFVIKLEKNIAGVPNEILVQTFKFGYVGIGDKVILQGRIFRKDPSQWGRPIFSVIADHFYNESLQIGDEGSKGKKQELYKGAIRGLVTRDSTMSIARPYSNLRFLPYGFGFLSLIGLSEEVCFVMRLEEGFEGVPDEILVRSGKRGYFRIGDKVILNGKIFRIDLKLWGKPMYLIQADQYYNESLQIGD
jgi:hypothetical protein